MIPIKTSQDLKKMQEGGRILAETLQELASVIKPGITEVELDKFAEKLIVKKGAQPGFKKVDGYNFTLCVSTNDQVVHGLPTNYVFKEGDLAGLDCGVFYKGFFTDMAETLRLRSGQALENDSDEIDRFLETGKRALDSAIDIARSGNRIGQISEIIQEAVEKAGYSVVKTLVGHGIGNKLHEEPEIPGFLSGDIRKTPVLKSGMTLAIEVIYNMGKAAVIKDKEDSWTIRTKDGSLSATFEKTIAVTKTRAIILT